ncbi:protein maelstrom homolog isoform X2 [Pararge aegeria]|uniref:protein maelstrom homolog isoform X2 n=1 Tax=Pararge aegeria TaxID=116150 RepID=UPI0019CFEBED|nr:protein maelstrom homolog isoform X2 [Pararge aegeria]
MTQDAPPPVRTKYETRAKKERQKYSGSEHKLTSNGIPFAVIDQQARELQEAIENEKRDIINIVNMRTNTLNTMDVYVMDVNCYCKASVDYVVGESTLLRFNVQEGIKDSYHEIINPGSIPVGYASDVKYGSQDLGLNMPDETAKRSNYMQILANIIDYLKQQDPKSDVLPPIFTMPDKVAEVQNFILQMCRRAGEDDSLFRIYQLDTLFFNLINAIRTRPDEGFPKESLALALLKKDGFKYTPGIGCEHHEENDKSVECSLSRVKRWVYTILDSCCPVAGVDAQPGKHVPADFDLESIHVFQEQKKIRNAPSIAGYGQAMSSCNTTLSDHFDTSYSALSTTIDSQKEKRVHKPLRMPKTNYADRFAAPELTEFSGATPLAGRCPTMPGSFTKLKLDDDE